MDTLYHEHFPKDKSKPSHSPSDALCPPKPLFSPAGVL